MPEQAVASGCARNPVEFRHAALPEHRSRALNVGPLHIHWYGIMYLIGFAAAWWLARRRATRPDSNWRAVDVDDFLFYAMLGVIIGGRIGYVLFYGMPLWRADLLYPLKIWEGGMSFHGGLLGVISAHGAVRAGSMAAASATCLISPRRCQGSGCSAAASAISSMASSGAGRPMFPGRCWCPMPNTGREIARHPSQLYEATLEGLVLFTILWLFTSRPRPRYAASGLFLVCYSCARILVEFVREPDVGIGYLAFGWLTMGQVLSAPMLLLGIVLLLVAYQARVPSGNYAAPT